MSSFICSPKHFNSIAENLKKLVNKSDFYIPYVLSSEFKNIYDKNQNCNSDIDNIIDTLRDLNVLANCLQYKDHYEGVLDKEISEQSQIVKTKTSIKFLTNLGLYNALRCLNYQIEVEHIEELRSLNDNEQKALLFLENITNSIAKYIVSNIDDDNTNTWSID